MYNRSTENLLESPDGSTPRRPFRSKPSQKFVEAIDNISLSSRSSGTINIDRKNFIRVEQAVIHKPAEPPVPAPRRKLQSPIELKLSKKPDQNDSSIHETTFIRHINEKTSTPQVRKRSIFMGETSVQSTSTPTESVARPSGSDEDKNIVTILRNKTESIPSIGGSTESHKLPRKTLKKHRKQESESTESDSSDTTGSKGETTSSAVESNEEQSVEAESKNIELPLPKERNDKIPDLKSTESNRLIGIVIHETGKLRYDPLIRRPHIKIHIFNASTGSYIEKVVGISNNAKSSKKSNKNVEYIQPIITSQCQLKPNSFQLQCTWNSELIVFNDDIDHVINENAVILFEVISMLDINQVMKQRQPSDGWVRICWAFMKLKRSYLDQLIKLQLYEYPKRRNSNMKIFEIWAESKRTKYPSYLELMIKDLQRSQESIDLMVTKSQAANVSHEENVVNESETKNEMENNLQCKMDVLHHQRSYIEEANELHRKWNRIVGNHCPFPTRVIHTIETYPKGSMTVKFNPNRNLFAFDRVSKDNSNSYEIVIAHGTTFKEITVLKSHNGLIYDLNWLTKTKHHNSDEMLLSASADFTAIIWIITNNDCNFMILPHPSFVYAAKFINNQFVVTGGRDHIIRIWNIGSTDQPVLKQEFYDHTEYITSIDCVQYSGKFYSCDAIGMIREWKFDDANDTFMVSRKILSKQNSLFHMQIQGGCNRVYAVDLKSIVRCFDLKTGVQIQVLGNPSILSKRNGFCLSPCGTKLFSIEDNCLIGWNLLNGQKTNSISIPINEKSTVCSIDYHPSNALIALSVHGYNGQIVILQFESEQSSVLVPEASSTPREANEIHCNDYKLIDIIKRMDNVLLMSNYSPNRTDDYKREAMNSNSTKELNQITQTYSIQRNDSLNNKTFSIGPGGDGNDNKIDAIEGTYNVSDVIDNNNPDKDNDTSISESLEAD